MRCEQIQTNWDYKSVFLKKNTSNDIIDYMINNHGNRGWELFSSTCVDPPLMLVQSYTFRRIRSSN